MSRVEEAMTQLDRALARLEAAGGGTGGRADRETEHRRLRDIAGQIAARVDNALARIDLALRGGAG
jgi:hypothetical protein